MITSVGAVTKVLLSLHVLAAILAVGPVTVAASMFPAVVRRGPAEQVRLLHRICRVYAGIGVAVPVFGFATASSLGVLGDVWLLVSIGLTAVAAAVLVFQVLPGQAKLLDVSEGAVLTRVTTRLGMSTGIFNLLWATVTVLMIVRPGSTTGA
ncbi:hypothetical protein CLV71_103562 [Actinophytocola oryzae]|uniref:Uncharacterized protein n=1 Tax=Actinophytocola oryzae TaxID=502181 RepID=A0A4V3FUI1_9PSEU|nr:hypothetical protein CLV71_103562 [Actinophytocola oryzae]